MSRRHSPVALFVSMSIAAFAGQNALAQSGSGASQGGLALEEIVVTARKREESLQDVPLAVTAITSADIANRQVTSIDDVAKFAPGLVFAKTFGRATERPVVRGLASVLAGTNASVETGVSYFVDGVYYQGDIGSLDMSDIERVEVIRGPQSALYGRNTYSGAINFVTRKPSDQFTGGVNGTFDPDERQMSARMSGRLTDSLAASVNMRYYDFDGQWKNQLTGKTVGSENTVSVGGMLNFTPSENVDVMLRLQHNRDDDGTRALFFQSGELNNCYPGTRSLASYNFTGSSNSNQWYCGEVKALPVYLNDAPVTQPVLPLAGIPATIRSATGASQSVYTDTRQGAVFSGVKRDLDVAMLRMRWDIGGSGYSIIASGGWRDEDRFTGADSDHSAVNIIGANINGVQPQATGSSSDRDTFKDWSAELKLESPRDASFRWLVGAYKYDWERRGYRMDFVSPKGQDNPQQIFTIENSALFGSLEFDFTEQLSASVELRRATEKKGQRDFGATATSTSSGNANVQAGPLFLIYDSSTRGNDEWKSTTPRVTVDYKVNDDVTVYANYSKGYKPGGFNGSTAIVANRPADESFRQEESLNYELGMKSTWMDRRVLLNVAIFQMKVNDMQLTTPVNNPVSGAITSLSTNQGDGKIKGIEIESRFVASENLTLGLNYALADTKFTKGCDDFQFTITSGGGILNPSNPSDPTRNLNGKGDCSIVGHAFPLAAKHTGSLTADYLRPVFGGDYRFYINTDLSYSSKRNVQVHNVAYTGAASLLGARIGIETDSWKIGAYGRNLLNEDSVVGATRWLHTYLIGIPGVTLKPGLPSTAVASYSLPRGIFGTLRRERQIGIEASYKF
jgi:iron complex outermembrane receptor protein